MDLGLAFFLVLSDGTRIVAPKPLARMLRILRRRSGQFSRKRRGSRNFAKAVLRLAVLPHRVWNIRRDFLRKVTTWLATTKPAVVVEGLNVRGLGRERLSRSIADVGWGMFRRVLEYKCHWYGARLIVAEPSPRARAEVAERFCPTIS